MSRNTNTAKISIEPADTLNIIVTQTSLNIKEN